MRQLPRTSYPDDFKDRMVQRYLSTSQTLREIGESAGVSPTTLRDWVRRRRTGAMSKAQPRAPATTVDERSPQDKLRLLAAAKGLADAELGEFLRREGLREGDLERWEQDALGGLGKSPSHRASGKAVERQLRDVEAKYRKTEKRLREAEALLELQKKVQELWGAEGDDTRGK
jgi:transposase-like protein